MLEFYQNVPTPVISAVIISKNEERQIGDCLKSCQFADEIILVDDFSTDRTCEIARKYKARVYLQKLDSIASQADFGYKKAKGEWILAIAADERITKALAKEIKGKVNQGGLRDMKGYDGYNFYFQSFLFGQALRPTLSGGQIRLFKKSKGYITREKIHEKIIIKGGNTGQMKNPIRHYSYPSTFEVIDKFNRYTNPEAMLSYKRGERTNVLKILISVPRVFWWRYLVGGEWRDGKRGFILSMLFGIYHLLVQLKLWEIQGKTGQVKFDSVEYVAK